MANKLIYTASRVGTRRRADVKVSLADECKNGHNDFHITGTIYEKSGNGHWRWSMAGCCHEELYKFFPKLRAFIPLHGCDWKGAPTYAVENGHFFLFDDREGTKEKAMNYLRVTEDEYERLHQYGIDKLYLKYLLYEMGIVDRWKREADDAIALLEELTGETFEDNSVKSQITPLTDEERVLIETRIADNYYSQENIQKREAEKREAERLKKIADMEASARAAKAKIDKELQVKLFVLNAGMPLDSFIYYYHTNTGVFHWSDSYYRQKVTEEEFEDFLCRVDYNVLPTDIKFQLGK